MSTTTVREPEVATGHPPDLYERPEVVVLENTLALLEKRGWVRGKSTDDAGRMCLIVALHTAGQESSSEYVRRRAERFLKRAIGDQGVVPWNDRWWRTYGSVRRALRRAIRNAS